MNKYTVGQSVLIEKIFTEQDVKYYSEKISVDVNPIHYDKAIALQNGFEACLVPGLIVSSLFGGLLGSKLPGKDTIHLGQTCKFIKLVYVGEEVKAVIEIIAIRADKPIITFSTVAYKENGEIAIEGEAVIKFKL